jgi:hypothetical protein
MPRFVVIENNVVVNVIIAESNEDAVDLTGLTCIESDVAGISWTLDSATGTLSEPIELEVEENQVSPEPEVFIEETPAEEVPAEELQEEAATLAL